MNVELQVGDAGLPEAVVGRAEVVAGVVPRHGGEGDRKSTDRVLASRHLAFLAVPAFQ